MRRFYRAIPEVLLDSEEVNPTFGYRKANHHVFAWYLAQFPGCETRHENIRSQLHLITRRKRSDKSTIAEMQNWKTRRNFNGNFYQTFISMIHFYNKIKKKWRWIWQQRWRKNTLKDVLLKATETTSFSFHLYKYREKSLLKVMENKTYLVPSNAHNSF